MGKDVTYMELIPNDKRDVAKEISPRQEEEHVGLNPKDERNVSHVVSYMDNHVPGLVSLLDAKLNTKGMEKIGLKEANDEVGLSATRPNKQIAKWTRLSRMENGPNEPKLSSSMLKLGKKISGGCLPQKRSKLGSNGDDLELTSVGVVEHPCQEQ